MKLIISIVLFLLVVLSGMFITFSLQLFREQETVRKKLGDRVFDWLTEETNR